MKDKKQGYVNPIYQILGDLSICRRRALQKTGIENPGAAAESGTVFLLVSPKSKKDVNVYRDGRPMGRSLKETTDQLVEEIRMKEPWLIERGFEIETFAYCYAGGERTHHAYGVKVYVHRPDKKKKNGSKKNR